MKSVCSTPSSRSPRAASTKLLEADVGFGRTPLHYHGLAIGSPHLLVCIVTLNASRKDNRIKATTAICKTDGQPLKDTNMRQQLNE